ncbi:hypothetical protein [uncultured Robinsoniella sp.]|uniref:hypothetical protein n=1 Tax=uncultured Robinsoniella sp. TaxID=904190 RepID=UPI00374E48A8
MIRSILQQNMLFYAMAAICILGVISQLVLNILYDRLIRDAENYTEAKGKFMKRLRQQYVASKRLNEGLTNTSVFVKKSIYEYQCIGMSLHQWRRMGGTALVLCLGIAGAGYLLAGAQNFAANIVQNYLWAGGGALLLLLGTQAVIDVGYKNRYLQVQLEDYLANSGIGHAYKEVDLSSLTESEKKQEPVSEADSVKEKEKTPISPLGVKKRPVRPLESKAQKDKRELKQNLARIKEGLDETAAEREHSKERNTEILKQMDPAEQERVIREVLKEFLS